MGQQVKEAQEFFKRVKEGAETFKTIPDKELQRKITRVSEGAGEVSKHLEERTNPRKG